MHTTELNSKQVMSETEVTPSQLIFLQMLDEQREQTAGHSATRMAITQATTKVLVQNWK